MREISCPHGCVNPNAVALGCKTACTCKQIKYQRFGETYHLQAEEKLNWIDVVTCFNILCLISTANHQ